MKLSNFYIENFRSISEAKLNLSSYSVVFEESREVKSNIMKAICRGWNNIRDFSTYYHNVVSV